MPKTFPVSVSWARDLIAEKWIRRRKSGLHRDYIDFLILIALHPGYLVGMRPGPGGVSEDRSRLLAIAFRDHPVEAAELIVFAKMESDRLAKTKRFAAQAILVSEINRARLVKRRGKFYLDDVHQRLKKRGVVVSNEMLRKALKGLTR